MPRHRKCPPNPPTAPDWGTTQDVKIRYRVPRQLLFALNVPSIRTGGCQQARHYWHLPSVEAALAKARTGGVA
ncbi:MAG: hypothetical protein A3K19_11815 [Lentisphaerae bacterium RIFOXYB12_FULL_65_16]|nr:MAG: hypothetical protein A3K18_23285 [Lentisphaerae bacterium RIFOXYA12_64_32]OGV87998.1 MAG: hypothetical protein A3K19_11815 [Lentisphaerae bacterium RIFOXYB12_FULL_65_16]